MTGKPANLSEGDVNLGPGRRAWHRDHVDADTRKWLSRDERYFLHQSLSTPCLDVLAGCEGSRLIDLQGREYLDFHGNSLHQAGYAHPRVLAAVRRQLDTLSFCPRRYTNIPAIHLAEKLAAIAPGELNRDRKSVV